MVTLVFFFFSPILASKGYLTMPIWRKKFLGCCLGRLQITDWPFCNFFLASLTIIVLIVGNSPLGVFCLLHEPAGKAATLSSQHTFWLINPSPRIVVFIALFVTFLPQYNTYYVWMLRYMLIHLYWVYDTLWANGIKAVPKFGENETGLMVLNKLAKARKMRKPSGTLSLKKFGLGKLWVEKVWT